MFFMFFLCVIFAGSSSAEQAGKEKEDASDATQTENLRSSKVAIIEYLRSKGKYILLYLLQNFFIYFLLYSYYVSYHIAFILLMIFQDTKQKSGYGPTREDLGLCCHSLRD